MATLQIERGAGVQQQAQSQAALRAQTIQSQAQLRGATMQSQAMQRAQQQEAYVQTPEYQSQQQAIQQHQQIQSDVVAIDKKIQGYTGAIKSTQMAIDQENDLGVNQYGTPTRTPDQDRIRDLQNSIERFKENISNLTTYRPAVEKGDMQGDEAIARALGQEEQVMAAQYNRGQASQTVADIKSGVIKLPQEIQTKYQGRVITPQDLPELQSDIEQYNAQIEQANAQAQQQQGTQTTTEGRQYSQYEGPLPTNLFMIQPKDNAPYSYGKSYNIPAASETMQMQRNMFYTETPLDIKQIASNVKEKAVQVAQYTPLGLAKSTATTFVMNNQDKIKDVGVGAKNIFISTLPKPTTKTAELFINVLREVKIPERVQQGVKNVGGVMFGANPLFAMPLIQRDVINKVKQVKVPQGVIDIAKSTIPKPNINLISGEIAIAKSALTQVQKGYGKVKEKYPEMFKPISEEERNKGIFMFDTGPSYQNREYTPNLISGIVKGIKSETAIARQFVQENEVTNKLYNKILVDVANKAGMDYEMLKAAPEYLRNQYITQYANAEDIDKLNKQIEVIPKGEVPTGGYVNLLTGERTEKPKGEVPKYSFLNIVTGKGLKYNLQNYYLGEAGTRQAKEFSVRGFVGNLASAKKLQVESTFKELDKYKLSKSGTIDYTIRPSAFGEALTYSPEEKRSIKFNLGLKPSDIGKVVGTTEAIAIEYGPYLWTPYLVTTSSEKHIRNLVGGGITKEKAYIREQPLQTVLDVGMLVLAGFKTYKELSTKIVTRQPTLGSVEEIKRLYPTKTIEQLRNEGMLYGGYEYKVTTKGRELFGMKPTYTSSESYSLRFNPKSKIQLFKEKLGATPKSVVAARTEKVESMLVKSGYKPTQARQIVRGYVTPKVLTTFSSALPTSTYQKGILFAQLEKEVPPYLIKSKVIKTPPLTKEATTYRTETQVQSFGKSKQLEATYGFKNLPVYKSTKPIYTKTTSIQFGKRSLEQGSFFYDKGLTKPIKGTEFIRIQRPSSTGKTGVSEIKWAFQKQTTKKGFIKTIQPAAISEITKAEKLSTGEIIRIVKTSYLGEYKPTVVYYPKGTTRRNIIKDLFEGPIAGRKGRTIISEERILQTGEKITAIQKTGKGIKLNMVSNIRSGIRSMEQEPIITRTISKTMKPFDLIETKKSFQVGETKPLSKYRLAKIRVGEKITSRWERAMYGEKGVKGVIFKDSFVGMPSRKYGFVGEPQRGSGYVDFTQKGGAQSYIEDMAQIGPPLSPMISTSKQLPQAIEVPTSRVLSVGKSISVLGLNIKPTQKNISISKLNIIQTQKQPSIQIQPTKNIQIQPQKVMQQQNQIQQQVQQQQTQQMQQQQMKVAQQNVMKTTQQIIVPSRIIVPPPIPKSEYFKTTKKISKTKKTKGFAAFLRRRGKFQRVSPAFETKGEAISFGAKKALGEVAATFKIGEVKEEPIAKSNQRVSEMELNKYFRTYGIKGGKKVSLPEGMYIQRKTARLTTGAERKDIQRLRKASKSINIFGGFR